MNHYKRNGLLERQSAPLNPYDLAVIAEAFGITVRNVISTAARVDREILRFSYDDMGAIDAVIYGAEVSQWEITAEEKAVLRGFNYE